MDKEPALTKCMSIYLEMKNDLLLINDTSSAIYKNELDIANGFY